LTYQATSAVLIRLVLVLKVRAAYQPRVQCESVGGSVKEQLRDFFAMKRGVLAGDPSR